MVDARKRPTEVTRSDLRRATNRFFNRHWNEGELGESTPKWIEFTPQNVPEAVVQQGGCYAISGPDGHLLYVGLALAESNPEHPRRKAGILRRLLRHVIRQGALTSGTLEPKREAWNEKGGIGRILIMPFPSKYSYLAAALEIYLIRELGSGLVMNKSRVVREVSQAVQSELAAKAAN